MIATGDEYMTEVPARRWPGSAHRFSNDASESSARSMEEGVFYHQGTPVVEKSFNPTWVGAPQFCIYIYLDGQPSAVI